MNKNNQKERLRSLYKVDEVLQDECLVFFQNTLPHSLIADCVRKEINLLRHAILQNNECPPALTDRHLFLQQVIQRIRTESTPSLRRVINATGIVLHTNLGRAPLSQAAATHTIETACSYSTLEYDLKSGSRGSRHDHVETLICKVTGAEAAMVVNNNAAATMLVLSSMAEGREVIVSRGELVEIGGSFRIPDIMRLSGAILKEVGTTNKTHLYDYTDAIDPAVTAALMKIHTSNFRICGFTESVSLSELRKLGDIHALPVIYDMGSGLLADLGTVGLEEPTIPEAMKTGVDVILFSGDKLLGGPQAGIIIGRKTYIEQMKRHPLARVVRIDKMTLSALETLFFEYQDPERSMQNIPTLRMLVRTEESLHKQARHLQNCLAPDLPQFRISVEPCEDFVGGGSAPDIRLHGYAITLHSASCSTEQMERLFRTCQIPVISHVCQDKIWLHMRTVAENSMDELAAGIRQVYHAITEPGTLSL